jgi:tRNA(fMet)-specific endonuclease VapC
LRGYLLDTNVLSELVKKRPSPAVLDHLGSIPRESLATASICVTELRYGAARNSKGGEALWARLASEVLPRFRILPFGLEAAGRAGDIRAELELRGQPIGLEDILIGATALANGLVMVTRNLKHFERIDGLLVESWWEQESRH